MPPSLYRASLISARSPPPIQIQNGVNPPVVALLVYIVNPGIFGIKTRMQDGINPNQRQIGRICSSQAITPLNPGIIEQVSQTPYRAKLRGRIDITCNDNWMRSIFFTSALLGAPGTALEFSFLPFPLPM